MIPFLLDKYVVWGDSADQWVVEIKSYGGIDDLLEPGNIHAAAKTTGRKRWGLFSTQTISLSHVGYG